MEITGEDIVKYFIFFFKPTTVAMVVLHTHFALLYLRGGLCWDWGLACRRSTAIFTSENKSIQTLNTTVTWRSANDVHAKNGSGCVTVQMKQSARIQILKSKKDGSSKCRRFCRPICQIEFEMNPKWWTSFLRVKICKKLAELECIRFSSSNLGFRNSPNQKVTHLNPRWNIVHNSIARI